jgi:hypothetical protein
MESLRERAARRQQVLDESDAFGTPLARLLRRCLERGAQILGGSLVAENQSEQPFDLECRRGVKVNWEFPERDMLLIARGIMQIGSGSSYLRANNTPAPNLSVAFNLPEAHPYLIHIHDGTIDMRERRQDDRPDAVLRMPASTFTKLLYQRVGPLAAVRHGLRITGGKRPWRALRLMS